MLVKEFRCFPNKESNGVFLEFWHYSEGFNPGDGLCKNQCRYSKVSVSKRIGFQAAKMRSTKMKATKLMMSCPPATETR